MGRLLQRTLAAGRGSVGAGARCTLPFPSWASALCGGAPWCDERSGTVPCSLVCTCADLLGSPDDACAADSSGLGAGGSRELRCAGLRRPCRATSLGSGAAAAQAVLLSSVGLNIARATLSVAGRHALLQPAARRWRPSAQVWALRAVAEPPLPDGLESVYAARASMDYAFGSYRSLLGSGSGFELSYRLDWAAALAAATDEASKAAAGGGWRRANVLFASSNCASASGREAWVAAFAALLPVDSVGLCLRNRHADDVLPPRYAMDARKVRFGEVLAAKRELLAAYKFVIAIENTLAHDYVSEKFFDALAAGAVPIYLGAPNIDEYAPGEYAFVDARAPRPVADVADEVRAALADPAKYAAYHAWRAPEKEQARRDSPLARLEARAQSLDQHLCRVCAMAEEREAELQ